MKKIYTLILCILINSSVFAGILTVTVQNHVFSPVNFTINYGDTIKWIWVNGTHTTTSINIPAGASSWDQPITSVSNTYFYVPSKGGVYTYKCTPHFSIGMSGSFSVICPAVTAVITPTGTTTFCNGSSVTLLASVVGGNIYQWQKNGINISGAVSSSYKAKVTGIFRVIASNTCGSSFASGTVSVTVNTLPGAVISPADSVSICNGDSIKLKAVSGSGNTYQWYKNGILITGATTNSYYAKKAANYKVKVTKTATGCSKTSLVTQVIVNCRNEFTGSMEQPVFNIYPNPSFDIFNIEITNDNHNKYTGVLYDINGKKVNTFEINNGAISLGSSLVNGVYLLEIIKGDYSIVKKRIVKLK